MTTEAATSRARAAVIEIVGRAPVPPTAADLDLVAVVTLHRQPRVLLPRTVAAGAVLLVIGGVLVFGRSNHDARTATTDTTADGSSGTLDELRTDARRYAETFLRGTADDINSWHSSSCTDAITPDDVAASFFHSLGIDSHKEYQTNTGRPVMISRDGKLIQKLFA